jgi:5-methylcytosine-specific restriction endonuclease McrA
VPLACGGEHSMVNVQTAHFICNSRKQDAAMNEQLRLVA